ncbi:MAG TPA: selenide, water dikinase SelD, partial [Candidatus Baltobacteraceae bacterium]|nr:selenide, water dikinase SelD [Candidatus Baltobacteraceae bacterium]
MTDPNVLVGNNTADDAGVYRISDELALVQTVDFFTPIVDDPYDYGRIAAANALSDVYAMGARPLCALAIAAFPEDLDATVVGAILRGGVDVCAQAGIPIVGGHTIKDAEPKYGLAVSGLVHPQAIVRNDTGRAGDVLILTKPLGTGILTTARRANEIEARDLEPAVESMATLNRTASEVAVALGASAMTDVTGFGLIGHLREMLGTRLGARIDGGRVALLTKALGLAARDVVPGGTHTNLRQALDAGTRFDSSLPLGLALVLCDAQTSGGLLVAVDPAAASQMLDQL